MQCEEASSSNDKTCKLKDGGSRRGGEKKSWVSVGAGRELIMHSMLVPRSRASPLSPLNSAANLPAYRKHGGWISDLIFQSFVY